MRVTTHDTVTPLVSTGGASGWIGSVPSHLAYLTGYDVHSLAVCRCGQVIADPTGRGGWVHLDGVYGCSGGGRGADPAHRTGLDNELVTASERDEAVEDAKMTAGINAETALIAAVHEVSDAMTVAITDIEGWDDVTAEAVSALRIALADAVRGALR